MADTNTTGTSYSWLWWTLGVLAVIALLAWMFGSANNPAPGVPNTGATTTSTKSGTTTVTALVQNPAQYDGSIVTVEGQVGQSHSARLLTVVDPGSVGGKGIVVASLRSMPTVRTGDKVIIQGTVRTGVVKDLVRWMGIDTTALEQLQDRVMIVADTVTKSSPSSATSTPTTSPTSAPATSTQTPSSNPLEPQL